MNDDMMTVPREDLQRLFDCLVGSLDWGSGFLDTDDMRTVDRLAQQLGIGRVRCRAEEMATEGVVYRGQCSLPIGHPGGHEYAGACCDSPRRVSVHDDRFEAWLDEREVRVWRGYPIKFAALLSGVRRNYEGML